MFRLLRYFSVASLISVALAAVILGALYRQVATSHLRELGESNNVALAQIFANSIWPQYRSFADTARALDADALRRHPDIAKLHQGVLEVMRNTQVVKVKLYQRNGRTLFSTDPTQIGKDYGTNPGFISAIQGKPVSEITHRDKFSAFDEELENRDVLSSYIPLRRSADARIEGVLEIYSDVTDLLRSIDKEERFVILIVVAVLTVLYSVLFFIAKHADGVIRSQYARHQHMATHDALTGLPNRALLLDRINQSLASAERHGNLLAVAFIGLDNFKNINDSMGRHIGDKVLQILAQRLSLCLRKGDTLARLDGDEFVISLPDIQRNEDLSQIVQKLHNAIALPIEAAGHTLHLTASIGISHHQEHGRDVDTLMRNADTAMHHAKQLGRNRHLIFAEHMGEGVHQRVTMESEMRRALENNEFVPYYQPIVDLESGAIVGAELLLRWPNAQGAWIPPAEFIPVAEECGLIVPLSEWVLGEACGQLQAWRERGLDNLTVAVNLSPRDFASAGMAAKVAAVIERTGIDPRRLHLETTEGLLMGLNESILANFEALGRLGVKFAIDDFGIGYSSLGYLRRFSIDLLKIDHSFIQDLPGNAYNAAIVTAVTAMANGLGLTVIAEGVETDAQLAFLKQLGCHRGQGFLFSHPMPAAEFLSLALERLDMRVTV